MLRILTAAAPLRVALARTTMRIGARVAAPQMRALTHQPQCAAARTFSSRQTKQEQEEEEDEEDEEHVPVPVAEARANLASSLTEDVSELDLKNEWTETYVKERGITLKVNLDSDSALATFETEGHQVRVTFHANDYTEADQGEEDAEKEEEPEEPMNEQVFFVDVTNPSGKIIRIDCSNAADGELVIQSVSFPSDVTVDPTLAAARKQIDELPETEGAMEFNELTADSQENFLDLLEGVGVDDDLSLFVANQSQLMRTQKLAADFNKLKAFVQ